MHRYNQIVQPPNFDATPATAKADLGVGRRGKKNVHKFEAKVKAKVKQRRSLHSNLKIPALGSLFVLMGSCDNV